MKPSEKLFERLKKGFPAVLSSCSDGEFIRTFAGKWQKARGAWSWFFLITNNEMKEARIGGYDNIQSLLSSKRLGLAKEHGYLVVYSDKDFSANDPNIVLESIETVSPPAE